MMRKLAITLLLPFALLAMVACSDDDNGGGDTEDEPTAEATAEATDGTDDPTDEPTEEASSSDGGDSSASALFGAFSPLELLSGAGGGVPSAGPADPDLQAALLTAADLSSDFTSMGDVNYSLPTEFGDTNMAMSMFASGDLESGDFEAMVMSAAIQMPADALAEMGDFSELSELNESDLDEVEAAAGGTGLGISEVSLLDASGLGEGGAGIRMVMDFGELLGAFGAPSDESNPFAGGIAMDMYMFGRGDRMLMLMVMAPAEGGSDIDGKALAETMDRKIS